MLDDLVTLASESIAQPEREREPIGLLTHHLEHDPWVWRFVEELLECLSTHRAVRFTRPSEFLAFDAGGQRRREAVATKV